MLLFLNFQMFFSFLFCAVVYTLTGQPADFFRFGYFLLFATLTSLTAQSIGLLIGSATSLDVII